MGVIGERDVPADERCLRRRRRYAECGVTEDVVIGGSSMKDGGRLVSVLASAALVAALLVSASVSHPDPAAAVDGSQFRPGNIISDAVFYNSGTMSEADIQTFLQQRVPSCLAGYTCLKDYRQATSSQTAKVEGCAAYAGRADQTAASIIYSVARACGINPRVIIVLLEKEQSLVTDTWPTSRQYRSATGYGCPDTADCDANYYGFFNQVYNAAWQFKKYQYSPGIRAYQAGRMNTILWHPNTACGTSQVYIENQATAGLYLYTPYRPNAAALNNLYGTGDACSTYGNRNFWRIFNDWFGSTTSGGNLVRSPERATVYLIVGTTKHPIGDGDTYAAYAPLGPLGYVSQSYLDGLTTGRALKRLVRDENGRLYYVDRGGKYYFDTCTRVADFGYNCPDYVQLTSGQSAALTSRANLSNNVSTSNGLYHVDEGRRAQAIDASALSAAGFTERITTLTPGAIAQLPHTTPIMRDGVYVARAGTSDHGLWFSGALAQVSSSLHATGPLALRFGVRQLEAAGYDLLPKRSALPPVVEDAAGTDFALTPTGRARIDRGPGLGSPMRLTASVLDALPVDADPIREPSALKAPTSGRVYFVSGSSKRIFPGPEDRDAALALMSIPRTLTVSAPFLDNLTTGPAWIRPASLVKSSSANAVYLTDGATLHHVTTPNALRSLPSSPVRTMPDEVMAGLTNGAAFSTYLGCSNAAWLADGGLRYSVSSDMAQRYALVSRAPLPLAAATCAALPKASVALTHIVRGQGETAVYAVQDGRKRHVPSAGVLTAISGGSPVTPADAALLAMLPTMAPQVSADPSIVPEFIQVSGEQTVYLIEGPTLRRILTSADYEYAAARAGDPKIYQVTSATIAGFGIAGDYVRPGSVVRASGAAEVYLVDEGARRLYVSSMEIPKALGAPALLVVTPPTVAGLSEGPRATTRLRCGSTDSIGLGGSIYAVPSALAAHYAGTYVQVSAATCGTLTKASKPLERFLRGPSGAVFLIENGAKRHILSPSTLTALGGTEARIINVSDYSLAQFPTGSPIP
jgi:hypothetical protein